MTTVMATDRIRLIIDTDDVLRRAVHLRKIKMASGTTVSDVVNGILREALAQELAEVEKYGSEESASKKSKRQK
jgi:hypothetical protein